MEGIKLSNFLNRLNESVTLAFAKKARELKAEGKNVISLALGEPDFNTPDFIKTALKKAIDDNYSHYAPISGFAELKQAICNKFKRDNNIEYLQENIVVSTGAKQSIFNCLMALLNPEDELLIISPYWVSYRQIAELTECTIKEVSGSIENDFKVSSQELEAAITSKTKLIMFSSPCNPSGTVYSEKELKAFAEVLKKHPNTFFLADEIYEYINYGEKHFSIASIKEVKEQIITINGLSKGYAMTGYRLGYMAANKALAAACTKLQGQVTSGANSVTQMAAITALEANPDDFKPMVTSFQKRRDLAINLLSDIPGLVCNIPQGAFYIFADVSHYKNHTYNGRKFDNTLDLCTQFLEDFLIATVPGEAFGVEWHIRMSYASSETDIREACSRLKLAFAQLKK